MNIDYKLGDATYETAGWNSEDKLFINANNPFFKRGGYNGSESRAGMFHFNRSIGEINGYRFRMCLV